MFIWSPTYILVIIGALLCAAASINVSSTYKRYSQVFSARGLTAEACAEKILHSADIYDVRIERIAGSLNDHYSPAEKVLRLSDSVYGSTSVAAIGVAAHECGHALQHKYGYAPLKLRSVSVPVANFGSFFSWPVILIGLIIRKPVVARVGVILFGLVVLFQLITLPVEFNASSRALKILESENMLVGDELEAAQKVLKAAALTYVAALFSSILQLIRLLLITQGSGRDRN